MEALKQTVSNSTQCGLFIGEYKIYTLSGVTFSFNIFNYILNPLPFLNLFFQHFLLPIT